MITENALNLLEFPKLLKILSKYSHSEATDKAIEAITPLAHKEEIEKRLGQVNDIRRMSQDNDSLRLSSFSDIAPLLASLKPDGAVLDARELSLFTGFLSVLSGISSQLGGRIDLLFLKEISDRLTGFPHILTLLARSVDSEGNILDTASSLLAELRSGVRQLEGKVRKRLEEMMRDERMSHFLQDSFITERSGRWVIPVRMDSKGQVPGVVHDVSRSGETAFIEPLAIIGLSNELENLIAEQKVEEMRILRDICSKIRVVADEMSAQYSAIVHIDMLYCIAQFADELGMQTPRINGMGMIHLVGARHPLLSLALGRAGVQKVVPLDVRLGEENTIMVITGSNAGGKTIAIKTIGLLQLMAISGMPVPADSSSRFPLIHSLLIDIGDEQSIENNLSTFSAHVSNISGILKKADENSLVLIDELGTGTDPEEGAALSCAVLKEIRSSRALLFATTHLTDIKGFVHRTAGMVNASMEFDQKSLTPLYKLREGEPGQSHALEIAKRYGLPERIIESAKALLGGIKVEFDNLIADLNEKRLRYEKGLEQLGNDQKKWEEKNMLAQKTLFDAEHQKKDLLAKAYREAASLISDTKRQMRSFLDEMKKLEKTKMREVITQVETKQDEVVQKLREFEISDYGSPSLEDIRRGDVVFVRSLGYDASVLGVDLRHKRVRLRSGGIEIEVPVTDIGFKIGKSAEIKPEALHMDLLEKVASSRLNLVGLRVDEALSRLEPFLNHASLGGLSEVIIIHGFGTGILANAVREHLTGHPLVKHFRSGIQSEGGAGITVVTIT